MPDTNPAEGALPALVPTPVAAWRGWPWPARLGLHAVWVAFLLCLIVARLR